MIFLSSQAAPALRAVKDNWVSKKNPLILSSFFYQFEAKLYSALFGKFVGSRLKQGLGISPIVQQNQEFSIQNEDFPALPGYKGTPLICNLF